MNPMHGDKYLLARQRWAQLRGIVKKFGQRAGSDMRNYCSARKGGTVRAVEPSHIGESGSGLPTPIKLAGCP